MTCGHGHAGVVHGNGETPPPYLLPITFYPQKKTALREIVARRFSPPNYPKKPAARAAHGSVNEGYI